MTDRERSELAGYDGNWLAEMKNRNPEKYKVLRRLGIPEYHQIAQELRNQLGEMFWEISESKELTQSELYFNYCSDITNTVYGFSGWIRKLAFDNTQTSTQWRAMKKMHKVLKAYNRYKKDKYEDIRLHNNDQKSA